MEIIGYYSLDGNICCPKCRDILMTEDDWTQEDESPIFSSDLSVEDLEYCFSCNIEIRGKKDED